MTITRSDFVKFLKPGINEIFGINYREEAQQFTKVFTLDKGTSAAYEEDVLVPGFGLASVKDETGSIVYDTHQQGYVARYDHVVYGLGFKVSREEIDDNKYPKLVKFRSAALGNSMRKTKEVIHAAILNNAFDSIYTMGSNSDAKELCATDHPSINGTWSNELGTPAALGEKAIEDLTTQIRQNLDERGLRSGIMPRKLVVPAALEWKAARIMNSRLQSGTANNDPNALRDSNRISEGFFVYDYLTSSSRWFILTDCDHGLKRFQRRSPEISEDNDFDTENVKFKAVERYVAGWSNPRGVFASAAA
jgi:hypothetical protein